MNHAILYSVVAAVEDNMRDSAPALAESETSEMGWRTIGWVPQPFCGYVLPMMEATVSKLKTGKECLVAEF